jgi:hypothetical protein
MASEMVTLGCFHDGPCPDPKGHVDQVIHQSLFVVETVPEIEEPATVSPVTEADMCRLLAERYTYVNFGCHRYAFAAHVPSHPAFPRRIADFLAMDCWQSSGFALHGHEIKVTRSDWLKELKDASKADSFRQYCDYWWLVVSHVSVVRPGELPPGWGLMVKNGPRLRAARKAPKLDSPKSLPRPLIASLLRGTAAGARLGLGADV